MDTFQNRLKQILNEKKISQIELSKRTGIGRNSISDYINGKYEAKQDKVYAIAKALNISEAWLMGFDVDTYRVPDEDRKYNNKLIEINKTSSKLSTYRQQRVLDYAKHQLNEQNNEIVVQFDSVKEDVSVYGYASAGSGEHLFDEAIFTVTVESHVPPHDLALQVNGDSMEPMFEDKEIIFIEKVNEIYNGQIGVFIIDGEAFVKKVFVEDNNMRLVSLNKKYKDIYFNEQNDIRLIGKVVL